MPFEDYDRLLTCVEGLLDMSGGDTSHIENRDSELILVDDEGSTSDGEVQSLDDEEIDPDNTLLTWLRENCTLTGSKKDKARFPDVLDYYKVMQTQKSQTKAVKRNHFYESLRSCGLLVSTGNGYEVCHGIILRAPQRHAENGSIDLSHHR